ncbi:MAG TPA: DUF3105 domain-containing protein [Polyangiaceae bacterium]
MLPPFRFSRFVPGPLAPAFAFTVAACGSHHSGSAVPFDASVNYEAGAPQGTCAAVEEQHPIEGYTHVTVCSPVSYDTKPPSSGNHYPIWTAYKTYTTPVPEGFYVHNLEHGGIVLTYNCPNGCDADVAAAQAMLDALPTDPICTSQGSTARRRSVMTPDPNLDVPFAASAWGWTLRANCFDADAFQSFALRHYDQGREDICSDGTDVTVGLAANCGQ